MVVHSDAWNDCEGVSALGSHQYPTDGALVCVLGRVKKNSVWDCDVEMYGRYGRDACRDSLLWCEILWFCSVDSAAGLRIYILARLIR